MGREFQAKCNNCGHRFTVRAGGGFFFHLLHCEKCGREKDVSFKELGEDHLRYLKGLGGPYCMASSESDKRVRENYPGDPISEKEYHGRVEESAGVCECGGRYRLDAPPRCTKCKSDDFEETDGMVTLYD
jgi:hypothetical protein